MTDTRQNTEDALAEVIDQSLGPDWTARDAARMIMDQLSDIGLQYADNVAISQPNEPGSFKGDIWFGHPEKRALGTHQWNGERWQVLPSELDSCLQLLAQARADKARLMGLVKGAREALGDMESRVERASGWVHNSQDWRADEYEVGLKIWDWLFRDAHATLAKIKEATDGN